jgi:DTW domain-containing protein
LSAEPEFTPRPVCYRCDKPRVLCLCARIARVDNRTEVFVLQHPRERQHPVGTARLARLGLHRARVEVAWNAGMREDLPPAWLPPGTALLYPSPGARDLSELSAREHPRRLLVLDGTWHTASSLYRDKTWLRALPHLKLSPPEPSRYRLRREPADHCVSTIEAIVAALRILEPDTAGLPELLGSFDQMVDDQLGYMQHGVGRPHRRARRPPALRRLPEAIASGLGRLVVVYAESMRASLASERELVQLTAEALGTGVHFQRQLRPRCGLPSEQLLSHMQLGRADFDGALDIDAARQSWDAFLAAQGERPIITAWNQSTLGLLRAARLAMPEQLLLKSAYRGRCGTLEPTLEAVVEAQRLMPRSPPLRGRAAHRVGCAAVVARYLHGLQHEAVTGAHTGANRTQ